MSLVSIVIIISFSFSGVAYPLAPESRLGRIGVSFSREEIRGALTGDRKHVYKVGWKYVFGKMKPALRTSGSVTRSEKQVVAFLLECSRVLKELRRYPVESKYPVLKAIRLLERGQQERLVLLLKEDRALRNDPLIDRILLMLERDEDVPDDWVDQHAPNLNGRTTWIVSSEVWNPAGGLGRVLQTLANKMKAIFKGSDARVCTLEPAYQFRKGKQGDPEAIDYSQLDVVGTFQIEMGKKKAKVNVVAYHGVNNKGVDYYLLRDVDVNGNSYYAKMLYAYSERHDDSKVTWEEFSEFFSKASLKLIKIVEENNREEFGPEAWKPPVIHLNDSQLAPAALFKHLFYSDDPAIKDALVAFTTHTYGNRRTYSYDHGKLILEAMDIPEELIKPLFCYYQYNDEKREWELTIDMASGGLRSSNFQNGVSDNHVDDVKDLDEVFESVRLIALTNGDDVEATAKVFRRILQEDVKAADVEWPTPEEVVAAQRIAMERINEVWKEKGIVLDVGRMVIAYMGRIAHEKVNPDGPAFTKDNIEAAIASVFQVVILGNVQNFTGSADIYSRFLEFQRELDRRYPGLFYAFGRFTLEEQRELLAIGPVQTQPSILKTEANGFTETNVNACGGLVICPSEPEGGLMSQGIDFDDGGQTIIPESETPEGYRAAFMKVADLARKDPDELARRRLIAILLSKIVEGKPTAAAYAEKWSEELGKPNAGKAPAQVRFYRSKDKIRFKSLSIINRTPGRIGKNDTTRVRIELELNGVNPDDVDLYFWYGKHSEPDGWKASKGKLIMRQDGTSTFKGKITPSEVGENGLTVFIVPKGTRVEGLHRNKWKHLPVWRNVPGPEGDINFIVDEPQQAQEEAVLVGAGRDELGRNP